jgi:hypothetical protein
MDEKSKREVMGIIVERAAEKGGTHFDGTEWRVFGRVNAGVRVIRPGAEMRRGSQTITCFIASAPKYKMAPTRNVAARGIARDDSAGVI